LPPLPYLRPDRTVGEPCREISLGVRFRECATLPRYNEFRETQTRATKHSSEWFENYKINVYRASEHSPQYQARRGFRIQKRNDRHPDPRESSDSPGRGCSKWDLRMPVSDTQSPSGLILTTSQMNTFLPLPVDHDQSVFSGGAGQLAGILKMYDRSKEQIRQGSYPLLCRTAQRYPHIPGQIS
jgi:hypothetical protein